MEVEVLVKRQDDLESKLAWQEQTISQLDAAISEQALAITRVEQALKLMSNQLKIVVERDASKRDEQEPPPHY